MFLSVHVTGVLFFPDWLLLELQALTQVTPLMAALSNTCVVDNVKLDHCSPHY